jgi:hypothetical protein
VVKREIRLGREPEQFADELSLADRIPFNQPSHAALSVGSRTGAVFRRFGLSVCSPFPLGVPH